MIFVTLGSQKFQFNRLLIEIDRLIEEKKITEEVFAQIGYSDYKPRNYEYKEFLERIKNKSIYKSDISVNENDKIITLSTCSYEFDDARLVVTGKLIDKEQ